MRLKGGHFRSCWTKAEDIIDEEPGHLVVQSEVLRHGERRKANAMRDAGAFVSSGEAEATFGLVRSRSLITPIFLELFVEVRCLRGCARHTPNTRRRVLLAMFVDQLWIAVFAEQHRHTGPTLALGGRASRSINLMPVSNTLGLGFQLGELGSSRWIEAVSLDVTGPSSSTGPKAR